MTITVNFAPDRPGSGKTYNATKFMATRPAKWVYAYDRNDVVADRINMIRQFSDEVEIIKINGDTSSTVRRDIMNAAERYHDSKHIIIMITHEGLLSSDLSHFAGWKLYIDETPQVWHQEEITTSKYTIETLKKCFTLRKVSKMNAYRIRVKDDIDIADLSSDSYLNGIMGLYKAAKQGIAYTDIKSWNDAKKWDWWTLWNFDHLAVFGDIYIVANAFEQSLAYKLMKSQGVNLQPFQVPTFQSYTPRKLTVRYFDNQNRAGSYFFQTDEGKAALNAIGKYFSTHPVDIWSCNHKKNGVDYAKILDIPGKKLDPMVAGSNSYKNCTSAAFIYSAKPSKTETKRLKMFNISYEEVVRSRETETIIQFGTRLAIRNPQDDRECTYHVYDYHQAEALKSYFDGLNMGLTTEVEFIDLGISKRVFGFLTAEQKKANRAAVDRAAYEKRKARKAAG